MMRPYRAIAIVASLGFGIAFALAANPITSRPPVYVVAMLGQSNAVGHACIPADADLTSDPRVMVYDRTGAIAQAKDPLDGCRGGWGVALGRVVANHNPGCTVLLVPAAVNGSSVEEWVSQDGHLNPALQRIHAAIRAAEKFGTPTLVCVWDQGESDMMSEARAAAWPDRFRHLTQEIRRQWPGTRIAWSVTAQPQAEPATRLKWWREVQAAQCGMVITNGSPVDMRDLPMEADGVHRTWAAQQVAANRFYGALGGS